MNKDKLALIVVVLGISVTTYLAWVADTYKPVTSNVTSSKYTPEKVKDSEIPEIPELSDMEKAKTDSLHKSYVKEAEQESERKSIENMRNEVIKILDEAVEQDSTITVSFNMQWTPSWVD
jgi:hypothetical protein|tara:strand:- start:986 stop:1345 length:360 start_codon:yes stop_codon:yes gene_type:complete